MGSIQEIIIKINLEQVIQTKTIGEKINARKHIRNQIMIKILKCINSNGKDNKGNKHNIKKN